MTSTDAASLPDLANLPDDVELLKQMLVELAAALERERAAHRETTANFHALLKRVWGPKSEKGNAGQLSLFDYELDVNALTARAEPPPPPPPPPKDKTPRTGAHGRRRRPDNLAHKVVVHDLTDAEKQLLGGEAALQPLADQVTTQYEWTPSSLIIIEHRQKKYARRATPSTDAAPSADASLPVSATEHGAENVAPPVAVNVDVSSVPSVTTANDTTANDATANDATANDATANLTTANDAIRENAARKTEDTSASSATLTRHVASNGADESLTGDVSRPATATGAKSDTASRTGGATASHASTSRIDAGAAEQHEPRRTASNNSRPRRRPVSTEQAVARSRRRFTDELRDLCRANPASAIIVAPKPPQAIPGGEAGPCLLAQTIICKYADHLPLYRLERIFARHGARFSRSTMCDWSARCGELFQPLLRLVRDEMLKSFVIHTDDTPVDVRSAHTKEKYQARFWTYWGDEEHPLVWFDFTTSRKRAGPDNVLRVFFGYLQADGYGGYDDYEGIALSDDHPILKVACWVHVRRKFRDALRSDPMSASLALGFIRRLYEIEQQIKQELAETGDSLTAADRYRLIAERRQLHATPVLTAFRRWLDEPRPTVLPKSPLSKALVYANNQWDALRRYVEDGRLQPDNNVAERALRGIALGRKAWLFCGSEAGGHTAAAHFSLIASAVRNGLEPYQYLSCLLTELPLLGDSPTPDELWPYMPHVWRPDGDQPTS